MHPDARVYRVRKLCGAGEFATITQALAQWQADKAGLVHHCAAVIEVADSATYHEAPNLTLAPGERLVLRAADTTRPLLRMFDYAGTAQECVAIRCGAGARLTIDGLLVAGGALALEGDPAGAPCQVLLRHCTLVPGWDTEPARAPQWQSRPSLVCTGQGVSLRIDHSIVGALQFGERGGALYIGDSIVDGGHAAALLLADGRQGAAAVSATFVRSTLIGVAQVTHLALAENAIFLGPLLAGWRDSGRVRHCYLAPGSVTPRRERCQPEPGHRGDRHKWQPRFLSLRYGDRGYAKLASDCAWEIGCGADDHGEMGAFHDLHRAPLLLERAAAVPRRELIPAPPLRHSDRRECVA